MARELPAEAAAWIEHSARREQHAARLDALVEDLCDALKRGDDFEPPSVASDVLHNVPEPVAPERYARDGALRYHAYRTPARQVVPRARWLARLRSHFAAFGLVHACRVHTFMYRDDGKGTTLGTAVHVDGLARAGMRLEEHMWLQLGFDAEQRLVRFEVDEAYVAALPRSLFSDVTEGAIGSTALEEQGVDALGPNGSGHADFGGIAVVDVDDDGRLDIYVARSGPNRLYMQGEAGSYQELAEASGVADQGNGRGVVFADLEGDGDLDLIVANMRLSGGSDAPLRVYRQDDTRRFVDATAQALGDTPLRAPYTHVAVADVDGDEDLDIFVAACGDATSSPPNHAVEADNGHANLLLVNDGGFRFRDEARVRGVIGTRWSHSAAFADPDDDGDPDLYVANDHGPNRFYRNDGQGHFEDAAAELGIDHPGAGKSVVWTDLDLDGRLDLYVSNTFSDAGSRMVPYSRRQHREVLASLLATARGNAAYLSRGERFVDATDVLGLRDAGWAWGATAFDYDLDGDEDLYQVNGMFSGATADDFESLYWRRVVARTPERSGTKVDLDAMRASEATMFQADPAFRQRHAAGRRHTLAGHQVNRLFARQPNRFRSSHFVTGLAFTHDGRSVVAADLDTDGDLDLALRNLQAPRLQILRNHLPPVGYALVVRLRTKGGNTRAVGARVHATCGDRRQVRQVAAGHSYLAQQPYDLHFGFGGCPGPVRLHIRWPDGSEQELSDVALDQRVTVRAGTEGYRRRPLVRGTSELRPLASRVADLRLRRLHGRVVPLVSPSDARRILLYLWSPSCEACKSEIPRLARWAAAHDETHRALFVSLETEDLRAVRRMARQLGVVRDVRLGDSPLLELYLPSAAIEPPVALLLDPRGRPLAHHRGPGLDMDALAQRAP